MNAEPPYRPVAPPLGVAPYRVWLEVIPDPDLKDLHDRFLSVAEAVRRYREAGLEPRREWLKELGL